MTMTRTAVRRLIVTSAALALMGLGLRAADPPDFKPDATFTGSALTGWQTIGKADWKAQNGELIGRPTAESGGWLLMNKSFQDVQWFANVRCEAKCRTGVLLRAEKTASGMKGIFVSFADGDFVPYRVTLDAQGQETARERIGNAPTAPNAVAAAAALALKTGEWNPLRINVWANTVRPVPGATGTLPETVTPAYGPIALFVGGSADVHFKDVAWKDVGHVVLPTEQLSPKFTAHQISTMYYGWGAAASDINRDGTMDVVTGPFYYLGPSYTERHIYRTDRVYNAATEYAPDMVNFTYDYTGDGWPDILASGWDRQRNTRPIDLYVNPRGEDRRWDHTTVLPTPNTETVLMRDLDGDGKPEMVFGTSTGYGWAKPDPANPTAPWAVHIVSSPNEPRNVHGMGGVGDINGDGKADIVVSSGWYEHPANPAMGPWPFHPMDFATATTEMGVYDVNGDGRTDVVASVSVHGWGLAWYEQKKGGDGAIAFVRHDIAGDYSTKNAGNVAFAEAHAARFVDMTGDKIPDFIVGKRYWSHLETYNALIDPYGPAVIYIYRTVRNAAAPGGAEFVPELVHNRSGVGSAFEVMDLNKDGKPDIAVATAFGTHVFLSKPTAAAPAKQK